MNHPAWILGHVCIDHPIIPALLNGEPFGDPADDPLFGFRGRGPRTDPQIYGSKQSQVDRYATGHEMVAQVLINATPEQPPQPPILTRWRKSFRTSSLCFPICCCITKVCMLVN